MEIRWSEEKNELLILPHPSRVNQKIIVVRLHGYIHSEP
jgi:hypothetical protein